VVTVFPVEFNIPLRTIYRRGAVLDLAHEIASLGKRGLVVHGSSLLSYASWQTLVASLQKIHTVNFYCRESGEPTLDEISSVIDLAHEIDAQWIVGIGGGSVIDLAKAVAGLYYAQNKPQYYQEGGNVKEPGIPFIAVPTTAGTGSEATPNAVIVNKEKKAKLSIRDNNFIARKIILDPELLIGMPPQVIVNAGMDALVQAYESYVSKNAKWFSETLALKAIELINRHIVPAFESGTIDDFEPLLLGSYFAGVAFASSRLGVIHGIAHPLGALYNVPHGLICALCFIPSIRINRDVMGSKYEKISDTLNMDFENRITQLNDTFSIASPFAGKEIIDKEYIIEATLTSGSTAANPKKIEREDVEFILGDLFKNGKQ